MQHGCRTGRSPHLTRGHIVPPQWVYVVRREQSLFRVLGVDVIIVEPLVPVLEMNHEQIDTNRTEPRTLDSHYPVPPGVADQSVVTPPDRVQRLHRAGDEQIGVVIPRNDGAVEIHAQ